MSTGIDEQVVLERVIELLAEVTEGTVTADVSDTGPGSLRRLGVSSLAMLEFLVAIEDEFGIEWDDEADTGIFDSLDAIAAHVWAETT
jgi:acyl carrier protein